MMGQQQSTNETARRLSHKLPHLRIDTSAKNSMGNSLVPQTSTSITPHTSFLNSCTEPTLENSPLLSDENEVFKKYSDKQGRSCSSRTHKNNLKVLDSSGEDCLRQSVILAYEKSEDLNVSHPNYRQILSSPSNKIIHPLEPSPLQKDCSLRDMSGQLPESIQDDQSDDNYDRGSLSGSGTKKLSYFETATYDLAGHIRPGSPKRYLESRKPPLSGNNLAIQLQRTDTPNDLDYRQIGAFKLGSLRITNGAASPVSSRERVHELENKPQTNEKNTHLNSSSADNSSLKIASQNIPSFSQRSSPLRKNNDPEVICSDADSLFHLRCVFKDFNIKDFDFNEKSPDRKINVSPSSIPDDPLSISSISSQPLLCSPKVSSPAQKNRISSKLSLVMNDQLFKEEPWASPINENSTFPKTNVISPKPPPLDESCIELAKPLVKMDSGYMSDVSFSRSPTQEFSQTMEIEYPQPKSPISDPPSFVSSISIPERPLGIRNHGDHFKKEYIQVENISRPERQSILSSDETEINLSSDIRTSFEGDSKLLNPSYDNVSMEAKDRNYPGTLSLPLTSPTTNIYCTHHYLSPRSSSNKINVNIPLCSHSQKPLLYSKPLLNVDRKVENCQEISPTLLADEKLPIMPKLCEGGLKNIETSITSLEARRSSESKIDTVNLEKTPRVEQNIEQKPARNQTLNVSWDSKDPQLIHSSLESSLDQHKKYIVERIRDHLEKSMNPDDRAMSGGALSEYEIKSNTSKKEESTFNSTAYEADSYSRITVGSSKNRGKSSKKAAISRLPSGLQSLTPLKLREKRSSQLLPCRSRSSQSTLNWRGNLRMSLPSVLKPQEKKALCFPLFSRPEYRQKHNQEVTGTPRSLVEDSLPILTSTSFKVPLSSIISSTNIFDEENQQNKIHWGSTQDKDTHVAEKYCLAPTSSISSASLQIENCTQSNGYQLLEHEFKSPHHKYNDSKATIQRSISGQDQNRDLSSFDDKDKAYLLNTDESRSVEISEPQIPLAGSDISVKVPEEKVLKKETNHSFREVDNEEDHLNEWKESCETNNDPERLKDVMEAAKITSPSESSHESKNRRVSSCHRSSIAKILTSSKCISKTSAIFEPGRTNSIVDKRPLKKSKSILSDETNEPTPIYRPEPQRQNWRVRSSNDSLRPPSPEILNDEIDENPMSHAEQKLEVIVRNDKRLETAKHGVRRSCTESKPGAHRYVVSNNSRKSLRAYPPQAHVTRRSSMILAKLSPPTKPPNFYSILENAQRQALLSQGPDHAHPSPSSSTIKFTKNTGTCPATLQKRITTNKYLNQEKSSCADKKFASNEKARPVSDNSRGVLYSRRSYDNSLRSANSQILASKSPNIHGNLLSSTEDKTSAFNETRILPPRIERKASDIFTEEDISHKRTLRNKNGEGLRIDTTSSMSILNRGRPVSRVLETTISTKLTETPLDPKHKPKLNTKKSTETHSFTVYDERCQEYEKESVEPNKQPSFVTNNCDDRKSASSWLVLDSPNSEIDQGSILNHSSSSPKYKSPLDSLPSQKLIRNRLSTSNLSLPNSNRCSLSRYSPKHSTPELRMMKVDKFPEPESLVENENKLKTRQSLDLPKILDNPIPPFPKNSIEPFAPSSLSPLVNLNRDRPPASNIDEPRCISRSPLLDSDTVQHKINEPTKGIKSEKSYVGNTAIKEQQSSLTNKGSFDLLQSKSDKPGKPDFVSNINQASRDPAVKNTHQNSNTYRSSTEIQRESWLSISDYNERRESTDLHNSHQTSNRRNSSVYGSMPRANNFPTIPKSIGTFYQGIHQPSLDLYYPVQNFETDTWSEKSPVRVIEKSYSRKPPKASNYYRDEKELVVLNSGWRKRDVLNGPERTNKVYSTYPDSIDNWSEKALDIHVQDIWKGTRRIDFWQ